jgi:hypothetical protein
MQGTSDTGPPPEWVKSSLSFANGNCVEVAWAKSSLSYANGSCVETAGAPDGSVLIRNSREPSGAVLRFTPDEWDAFIGGVRNGEFDRFGRGGE